MKPVKIKIAGCFAWYIWNFNWDDIAEGEGCGPFWSETSCCEAIRRIENEKN